MNNYRYHINNGFEPAPDLLSRRPDDGDTSWTGCLEANGYQDGSFTRFGMTDGIAPCIHIYSAKADERLDYIVLLELGTQGEDQMVIAVGDMLTLLDLLRSVAPTLAAMAFLRELGDEDASLGTINHNLIQLLGHVKSF